MKIILIIFTAASNSKNLAHCLLMAFSDLKKQKHENFLEKYYADACANIKQKPYGGSWTICFFWKKNKAKSQQELWWPMPQGLPKVSLKWS